MRDHAKSIEVPLTRSLAITLAVLAFFVAGALGYGSGAFMARVAPANKYSWLGLAVAPLWFLVEILFAAISGFFGLVSRPARIAAVIGVLAGFYIAWFSARPLGS